MAHIYYNYFILCGFEDFNIFCSWILLINLKYVDVILSFNIAPVLVNWLPMKVMNRLYIKNVVGIREAIPNQ